MGTRSRGGPALVLLPRPHSGAPFLLVSDGNACPQHHWSVRGCLVKQRNPCLEGEGGESLQSSQPLLEARQGTGMGEGNQSCFSFLK